LHFKLNFFIFIQQKEETEWFRFFFKFISHYLSGNLNHIYDNYIYNLLKSFESKYYYQKLMCIGFMAEPDSS
jgi:hypothetical protein